MAGRKRKPRALKILQGTFRPDRHGHEPDIPTSWPDPPAALQLNDEERELWNLYRDTHGGLGVAESDWPAIYGLVKLTARLRANRRAQQVLIPGAGGKQERLLLAQELRILRELRAYITITGRSPVDRGKVFTGSDAPTRDPFDGFLKRR